MNRKASHIMSIESSKQLDDLPTKETAIEALLNQKQRLLVLLEQIDGDLESLGYVDEQNT